MKRRKFWFTSLVEFVLVGMVCGKSAYYMDSSLDCGYIGLQDVGRDQTINVYAKTKDTSASTQAGCTINFKALDSDATIRIDIISFIVNDCNVKLYISGEGTANQKSYSCGDNPSTYFSVARTVTLTLHKTVITATSYNFELTVKAIRDDRYPLPSDSNPVAVGMVIGIVGSVFGVLLIIGIVGVCCFRKYRASKRPFITGNTSKSKLDESGPDRVSVGFTNESMSGSPASKKKLLAHTDSSSDSNQSNGARRGIINLRRKNEKSDTMNSASKPPPAPPAPVPAPRPDILRGTEDKKDAGGPGAGNPRASMLNALHNNTRFRNSFRENEKDAEDRAKRISSSSSFEQFGQAPRPPNTQETMSRPTMAPVPKSPKHEKPKLATIGRHPRSGSFSSDEMRQNQKGTRGRHDGSSSSNSEVSVATAPELSTRRPDTTHSLRPDRKGPRGRKKQTQSVSSTLDPEPKPVPRERERITSTDRALEPRSAPRAEMGRSPRTQRDRFLENNRDEPFEKMGSGRYSKRSNGRKSPRPGKSSGRGFSHRRGHSMENLDSRPTTPSVFGSMEDLDLAPLKRSTSKQSLYSSRSSLYDRRGRRRKGSFTDSVASHVRDDISVGRHSRGYDEEFYSDEEDLDGYLKPLSRRDKERMYRSDNDLGRRVRNKEIATQTLRETATQTGILQDVTMESKRLVEKKRRRSKSLSTAGTQTKKEKKGKTKSTEKLDEVGKDTDKKSKTGTKRSKSVPEFTNELEDKDKPRPKPKPRKSQSAAMELEEKAKTGSQENVADPSKNPYYPQSEGFVPGTVLLNQQGYPAVPPPGYPVQPGVPAGQQGFPAGYQYPGQVVPQAYPGYPPPLRQQVPRSQVAPPPPPQGQTGPRQPRKSNWETLCEMTDGEYKKDDDLETGSVASSVFTSNPASMQGYGAPRNELRPPNYSTHMFYLPYQPGTNQTPPLPPMPIQSMADYKGSGSLPPPPSQDYENANFGPRSVPQSARQNNAGKKTSSWDQLKQMTGQPRSSSSSSSSSPAGATSQALSGNSRTESIV